MRYCLRRNHPMFAWALLLTTMAFLFVASLACLRVGPTSMSIGQVYSALTGHSVFADGVFIVRDIRLPRVLLAMLVGGSLAVAGAVMQAVTRNPLASPSIAGLSGGGTLAVLLALLWFPQVTQSGLVLASIGGSLVAVVIVFSIATSSRSTYSGQRLALAGIMVSALMMSITSVLVLQNNMAASMLSWTLGGLSNVGWSQVTTVGPVAAVGAAMALALSPQLTVLSLGNDVARGLGQRTNRVLLAAMVSVLLAAGAAIAVAGPVAFVGLFVPHIVRFLVGHDYRKIIPISAVIGALIVLLADTVCRSIMQGFFELPVGLVTTAIGLPFFIALARAGSQRGELP